MSNPADFTLYSGAAQGSEATFGAAAERHGVAEVNYTFEGHRDVRDRGLRPLGDKELKTGDVSLVYVGKLMNRVYKDTTLFRRVLQSIWHMVNSGQQVFVVGTLLADGHVKGGTGWGAEFAKLCNKPLFVFDQDRGTWFRWSEGAWAVEEAPVITAADFTGTGTRHLNDAGRDAIDELFERSFSG